LGPNYAHFKQDRFDALLQDSRRELSPQRRNQLLAQADNLLMDQMPYIVLFYDESIRMHQNWVKGLTANPINFLRLRSVQKTAH
jgi:peptide/nickel transport system substrate-binding protein